MSSIAINSPKGISPVVGSVYKLSIKESKNLSIITTCSGVTDLSKSSTFCLVFMFMISVLFTENIFSVISVVKGQSKTDCVAAIYCTVYSVQCAGTSGFYGICVNRITSLSVAAQLDTNKNLLTVV